MLENLISLIQQYSVVSPILFILARGLAIVIPPIPGIIIDISGLAVFGWLKGFIYAEIGVMLGSMVAFYITRIFRERIAKKFLSIQKLHKWEDELSRGQKFWTLVVMRFFGNPFFDYVSYAAGLTKIKATTYFIATLVGTLPILFITYYFGGMAFNAGLTAGISFIAIIIAILVLIRVSRRNS